MDTGLPNEGRSRYLTEDEAAKYLGIPPVRLAKWRQGGRIAYHQPTLKTILYFRGDLDALLEATRVEATSPPARPQGQPKSPEHRAAIGAGQAKAWERRRAQKAGKS